MERFRVYFKTSAEKIFSDLSSELQQSVAEALFKLAENPFSRDQNVKKISGATDAYRIRVGRWRILYTIYEKKKEIEVIDIFLKKGKEDYERRLRIL